MARRTWINNGTVLIRLGPNHFAFLRGYLEGLPLEGLAWRYLESATGKDGDLKLAKANLRWIREQLAIAARRTGAFSTARVLFIEPDRLRLQARAELPTLEEFREIRDPHEMFTESELIELFHEEYGGHVQIDRRIIRNDRLRRRQVEALLSLERVLGAPPSARDDVDGWLDPILAKRLKAAGLQSIGDVANLINTRGFRWWTQVPRFGAKAAAQVVAWLGAEPIAQALGEFRLRVQASVKPAHLKGPLLAQTRPKEFGIVPLEYLYIPEKLGGGSALQAVETWLQQLPPGTSTWRSYRREAERFLIWMLVERRRSLSDANEDDVQSYISFLKMVGCSTNESWPFLTPQEDWLAPRSTRRWSVQWRPFEGKLSHESRSLAVVILALLGKWLVSEGLWQSNVFELVKAPTAKGKPSEGFSELHRFLLTTYIQAEMKGEEQARARWLLYLCQKGLRPTDLLSCTVSDVLTEGASPALALPAERKSGAKVTLDEAGVRAFIAYNRARESQVGCALPPHCPLFSPLLNASGKIEDRACPAISLAGLSHVLKRLFEDVVDWALGDGESSWRDQKRPDFNPEGVRALRRANAHWFGRRSSARVENEGERFWEPLKG
jgi:site-specific recombinase XerD